MNRLTSVDYGDGQTQGYSFDSMGNRTGKTDSVNGNESYVVNAANMLTSRTAGGTTNTYTNDVNGNTLTGGGRTNTWDSQNRLYKCVNGTITSLFTYGSDGIRHRSTVNNVSTDFVLDASMFVRELYNGNVKATYFMGNIGPAYRRDDGNGGAVRWYLYDGLGSVLGEVDPQGNITARRKYDVYGSTRTGSDAGTSKHKFVGSLGHPSEDETGLIYMRARYYDPQIGRFVSEDTKGDGVNWFVYCDNNPICKCDLTGKSPEGTVGLLLSLAYNVFQLGGENAVAELTAIMKDLQFYARIARLHGMLDEAKAEAITATIPLAGPASVYLLRIAETEAALGAKEMAYGTAAMIGAYTVELMIIMLQGA